VCGWESYRLCWRLHHDFFLEGLHYFYFLLPFVPPYILPLSTNFYCNQVIPEIFGPMHTYNSKEDRDELLKDHDPKDLRFKIFTTYHDREYGTIFRNYILWEAKFWEADAADTESSSTKSIQGVLSNLTHDLVFLNIGSHHQNFPIDGGVIPYMNFLNELCSFYKINTAAPLLWVSMNAQCKENKPQDRKYEDVHVSRAFNELAHWFFEEKTKGKIPMVDFHQMISERFPSSVGDGLHSAPYVDKTKWQIILNFLCPEGTFTLDQLKPKH